MRLPVARALRVLTVVVFVAVAAIALRTFLPREERTIADPRGGELNVEAAINGPSGVVIVRGHVFAGPGGLGLRLCQGRESTSPPACLGPFVDLDGVNEGNFSFESGRAPEGRVRWVEDPLALRGTIEGTRMRVTEVLR
ncbi:MAG TPA: hypothetical protein VM933_03805 [Acidimicrobiales bacterium]|nr:hypothetical protein [Acidimicrobiales bacterium]